MRAFPPDAIDIMRGCGDFHLEGEQFFHQHLRLWQGAGDLQPTGLQEDLQAAHQLPLWDAVLGFAVSVDFVATGDGDGDGGEMSLGQQVDHRATNARAIHHQRCLLSEWWARQELASHVRAIESCLVSTTVCGEKGVILSPLPGAYAGVEMSCG